MNVESYEQDTFDSVTQVVDFVQKKIEEGIDTNELPEFIRDPKEKPFIEDDLYELLRLPIEVGLTEEDNKVILTFGDEHSVGENNKEFLKRLDESKLSLHTHAPSEYLNATPISINDIWRINFRKQGEKLILLHTDGFTIYGKATKHPITKDILSNDPDHRDLIMDMLNKNKMTIFEEKGMKKFSEVPLKEQLLVSEELGEKSGIIKKEIRWDDKEGIKEVLDIINLKENNQEK